MKRYLLPLAGFIVLVVFLAIGLKLDPKHIPSPFIGKPAPAFDLPDLHSPQQRIKTADLKGAGLAAECLGLLVCVMPC